MRATPAATPDEVTLVVVTKFFPASDVRLLADLGVTDVGENRHQEAEAKAAECADLGLRWHFIGGLQSNKAAAVAAYADVVESSTGPSWCARLQRGAHERGRARSTACSRSASTRPARDGRSGADPADLRRASPPAVEAAGMLRLRGLMAVAPLGEDPAAAFARLAEIARGLRRPTHPGATWLSAGMSADLEAAVTRRRDTRARRLRGPRSEAAGQVVSTTHSERPDGRAESGGRQS